MRSKNFDYIIVNHIQFIKNFVLFNFMEYYFYFIFLDNNASNYDQLISVIAVISIISTVQINKITRLSWIKRNRLYVKMWQKLFISDGLQFQHKCVFYT